MKKSESRNPNRRLRPIVEILIGMGVAFVVFAPMRGVANAEIEGGDERLVVAEVVDDGREAAPGVAGIRIAQWLDVLGHGIVFLGFAALMGWHLTRRRDESNESAHAESGGQLAWHVFAYLLMLTASIIHLAVDGRHDVAPDGVELAHHVSPDSPDHGTG